MAKVEKRSPQLRAWWFDRLTVDQQADVQKAVVVVEGGAPHPRLRLIYELALLLDEIEVVTPPGKAAKPESKE